MKRMMSLLLMLSLILASVAAACAEPLKEDPAVGDWYSSLNGVPLRLTLNADGTWECALPAAFDDAAAGAWTMDDGFVRLDNGAALCFVNADVLSWAQSSLSFTREPCAGYHPAELLPGASPAMLAGYWKCAFLDVGGIAVPAEAVHENTDLYIESGAASDGSEDILVTDGADGAVSIDISPADIDSALPVALGGPRFGDVFWIFDFEDGALSADVNGQTVTLALQQDGYLRLTLDGEVPATLYLLPVLAENEEAQ